MRDLIQAARSAESILLPKSDDCRPAIEAFVEATGIEIPTFEYRRYKSVTAGRAFYSVSAKDIPRLVSCGYGDVGVTGYDQYLENEVEYKNSTQVQAIGSPMCYLALLAPENTVKTIEEAIRLSRYWKSPIDVTTSFPNIVNTYAALNDQSMRAIDLPISGSTEVMADLMDCAAVW